jgi:CHAT domain-containing protein
MQVRQPVKLLALKAAGLLLILAALSLCLGRWDVLRRAYYYHRVEKQIRLSQAHNRATRGRLSNAPYALLNPQNPLPDELGRAQLLALTLPDSTRTRYLEGLVAIGLKDWNRAQLELLEAAAADDTARDSVHNDLGVVYLELAQRDDSYLFQALEEFETAGKINPKAVEPRFNKLLVLRDLQLKRREEVERTGYLRLERAGPWVKELNGRAAVNPEDFAAQLRTALDRNAEDTATALFTQAPELSRKIAMQYARDPVEFSENGKIAAFVARLVERLYGDETISSMLSGLDSSDRADFIEARRLVEEGAKLYLSSDLARSIAAYDAAAERIKDKSSPFDHLWIELNRANSEIRLFKMTEARLRLANVGAQARERRLKWLLASALTSYGSVASLSSSYTEMVEHLREAIRLCDEIAAPEASARARYYLMGQRYFGGDLDGALRSGIQALKVTDPSDHVRLSSVFPFIGKILYKKGLLSDAIAVAEEAVVEATASKISSLNVQANTSLALISELSSHPTAADEALARAEKAVLEISEANREPARVNLNNAKARVLLHRGAGAAAETLLEDSRRSADGPLSAATWLRTETLMLLGQGYVRNNKMQQAKAAFDEAIDAAEKDNDFVKNERTRVAFDDGRRELYDSAIGFEYTHGSTDAAWSYMQKYRAKLFIEQLAQFNPEVERVHAIALDRGQVQKAIPGNLQVLEYALLPDRLLIWVITNHSFQTRQVPISREALEQKVRDFLASLRSEQPVQQASAELYGILFAPIGDLLDGRRSVAIIPDRALHGLPFAAIQSPERRYLIEQYTILESPTLTHLLAANPAKAPRDSIVTFSSRSDDAEGIREIGEMQTVYRKIMPFAGTQVTKASFLKEMEQAFVFHYAGHSAHDAADPLRSSILLDGDKQGPNSVTAVDIVGHKLRPNAVVVLSSCDSSVGNSKDGVGIRGLTSAFLIGGAGSVVGSLWPVDSTSTAALMIAFHQAFARENLTVADSLRKAQLTFLKLNPKRSHPYYWSGFVVTGNSSALR